MRRGPVGRACRGKVPLSVPVPCCRSQSTITREADHQEAHLPTTLGSTPSSVAWSPLTSTAGRCSPSIRLYAVKGTLYYWGTRLNTGQHHHVPDLQIANETKIALRDFKSGYWQMVNDERSRACGKPRPLTCPRGSAIKHALSGQHKAGGLAIDLLLAKQEAGQVVSTGCVGRRRVVKGTASRQPLPVKQASRTDGIQPATADRSATMMPRRSKRRRRARMPEEDGGGASHP